MEIIPVYQTTSRAQNDLRDEINQIDLVDVAVGKKNIVGMENQDYHQRLKKLKLYSLERRRERFIIINGMQQLEGVRENVLNLKVSERSRDRRIQLGDVKFYRKGDGRILPGMRTQILNSPARKVERLFNHIPSHLRNITGRRKEYFK